MGLYVNPTDMPKERWLEIHSAGAGMTMSATDCSFSTSASRMASSTS